MALSCLFQNTSSTTIFLKPLFERQVIIKWALKGLTIQNKQKLHLLLSDSLSCFLANCFFCLCVLSFYLSIHVSFFSCLCVLSFYLSIHVSFLPVCVICHSTRPYLSPSFLSVCLVILSVHTCLLLTLSFSHSVFTFLSHSVV